MRLHACMCVTDQYEIINDESECINHAVHEIKAMVRHWTGTGRRAGSGRSGHDVGKYKFKIGFDLIPILFYFLFKFPKFKLPIKTNIL